MVAGLCEKCQQVFSDWSKVLDSVNNVLEHNGCGLCRLFLTDFPQNWLAEERSSMVLSVGQISVGPWNYKSNSSAEDEAWILRLNFLVEYQSSNDDKKQIVIDSLVYMADATEPDPSVETSKLGLSTHCEQTLSLAKEWVTTCTSSHPNCSVGGQYPGPTRLLSLESESVHLVFSAEMSSYPMYATLSHCWGNADLLKLDRQNLENFRTRIPEEELCKTFTEAIYITRGLGLAYLWIDSLCIIQDDPQDWHNESATMTDVYGHSSVNIAASGARDGSVGCFFNRNVNSIRRLRISVPVGGDLSYYDCANLHTISDMITDSPLARRAWAFQERFLAPRTLHFTSSQVYWECRTRYACETYPTVIPERLCQGPEYLPKLSAILPLKLWSIVVMIYSRCVLTYQNDKLIALSGVARYIQNQLKDNYVAGLWRGPLETQFCWRLWSSFSLEGRSTVYQAPSWSWASTNGRITLPIPDQYTDPCFYVRVLRAETTPVANDPLGQVTGGILQLQCLYFIESPELVDTTYPVRLKFGEKELNWHLHWDSKPEAVKKVYFVPIIGTHRIEGIFLERFASSGKGHFRRLGYFMVSYADAGAFREVVATPECIPDESIYEESGGIDEDGNKFYVISII